MPDISWTEAASLFAVCLVAKSLAVRKMKAMSSPLTDWIPLRHAPTLIRPLNIGQSCASSSDIGLACGAPSWQATATALREPCTVAEHWPEGELLRNASLVGDRLWVVHLRSLLS